MERKMRYLIALFLTWSIAAFATEIPIEYVLYRNPMTPVYALNPTTGGIWQPVGGARSSSITIIDNRKGLMPSVSVAQWNLAYIVGATGQSYSSVRLRRGDSGYLNPVEMGTISKNMAPTSPIYWGVDVTVAWNAMLAEHKWQEIWFEVLDTNDGSGEYPKIYSSDIFVNWQF